MTKYPPPVEKPHPSLYKTHIPRTHGNENIVKSYKREQIRSLNCTRAHQNCVGHFCLAPGREPSQPLLLTRGIPSHGRPAWRCLGHSFGQSFPNWPSSYDITLLSWGGGGIVVLLLLIVGFM